MTPVIRVVHRWFAGCALVAALTADGLAQRDGGLDGRMPRSPVRRSTGVGDAVFAVQLLLHNLHQSGGRARRLDVQSDVVALERHVLAVGGAGGRRALPGAGPHSAVTEQATSTWHPVSMCAGSADSRLLAQYEGTDLHERLARAFERIGARLPEDMRARHAIVARALHFGGLPAPAIDPVVWELLLAAIQRREVVKVDYAALGEERAATRTLHPYQLLARDRDWFLVARHVKRRRELLYYLPRITSVRPTGEAFTPSRAFDADDFHERSFNAMQGPGDPVDVTLRFPPEHAALASERPWSRDQTTAEHDDGSVTVTFPSAALFEVQRQVLRYEGRVEVVEPEELRASLARTAAEIARVHVS